MSARHSAVRPDLVQDCRVQHPRYGLGVVDELDDREITVEFDTGQKQTFPLTRADLARVRWKGGDRVVVRAKDMIGVVRQVTTEHDLNRYTIELAITGNEVIVLEGGLAHASGGGSQAPDPLDGLLQRQYDHPRHFYARTMAHYLHSSRERLARGGATARIDPLPHQIFVAHRVVNADRPRFLLADEVGLGKTIEAGLILKELRARGSLQRVLIVVPANLTYQWKYELEQKFNERFRVYDAAALREVRWERPNENPWLNGRNIICSHGYIEQHEELWDEIKSVPWDMVVVDEAHHARRRQTSAERLTTTQLYHFVSSLSERARGLLLLTATPMQLHSSELFSLVELLDRAMFYNFAAFEEQRKQNSVINQHAKLLHEFASLTNLQRTQLTQGLHDLLPKDKHDRIARLQRGKAGEVDNVREELMALLSERHLLSSLMIRNRKRVVGRFTRRTPRIIPVQFSAAERDLYDAVNEYVRLSYQQLNSQRQGVIGFLLVAYQRRLTSSIHAFRRTVERRLVKLRQAQVASIGKQTWGNDEELDDILEQTNQFAFADNARAMEAERFWLQGLLAKAEAIREDAKYLAFEGFLNRLFHGNAQEQVLIFTQFKETLDYLHTQLSRRWTVATFHGQLSPKDKDAAIASFRDGHSRILVSTEAGGEGRNLQFCAVLVNYDLPWNPMKVEQRIGRVDRIGQRRDVQICNFAIAGTVEDRVLQLLTHRIRIFEETVGGLDPILGELEADIQKIVLETPLDQVDDRIEQRGLQLQHDIDQAKRLEEAQGEFVIDTRSFDSKMQLVFDEQERDRLLAATNNWSNLMLRLIGASVEQQADNSLHVWLGKRNRGILPQLHERSFEISFEYQQALAAPHLQYGSFGHPLFDALIDHGMADDFSAGYATHRVVTSEKHAGFRGFQFNFLLTEQSVHKNQSVVSVVVDENGAHSVELSDLLLDSVDWDTPPLEEEALPDAEWQCRVEQAYRVAEDVLSGIEQERSAKHKANLDRVLQAEEQRLKRNHEAQVRAGKAKLQHDSDVLNRLENSTNSNDQRVLPIWRHNVENATLHLQTLKREYEQQLAALAKQRRVSYSSELLNAARVSIIAPARKKVWETTSPSYIRAPKQAPLGPRTPQPTTPTRPPARYRVAAPLGDRKRSTHKRPFLKHTAPSAALPGFTHPQAQDATPPSMPVQKPGIMHRLKTNVAQFVAWLLGKR